MPIVVSNDLSGLLQQMPRFFLFGFAGAMAILAVYYAVKTYWRLRGNTAFTSYQYGVIAPVQYGDRGCEPAGEDEFSQRLDQMVEKEEAYDLAQLLPKARELGAIANISFRTAPVLDASSVGVLALIEQVALESEAGYLVLVHTSLESMIDLGGAGVERSGTKLSMTGVELKFAVVDRFGRLVLAVDHPLEAKLSRQEQINRAVVIEVLRKAGVWYLEIPGNYSKQDARAQLFAVLNGKTPSQHSGVEVA